MEQDTNLHKVKYTDIINRKKTKDVFLSLKNQGKYINEYKKVKTIG